MEGSFQVESVSSVDEAYQKMEGQIYDAVVSDYDMPLKDGLTFLKELRQKGKTIPFIIFTGRGREEVAIRALNLGADHYVNKTGSPETVYGELAHAVRESIERKRAVEKLRESEARYHVLFDNMAVGVVLVDGGGNVVSANEPECRFLGYSREELVGMNFAKYIYPDDFNIGAVLLKELVDGKRASYTIEMRYVRKDGKTVWGRSSGSAIRSEDGGFRYLVAVVEDITKRKEKAHALQKVPVNDDGVWFVISPQTHSAELASGIKCHLRKWARNTNTYMLSVFGYGELPNVAPFD
jgi:PAS domain S-box-containing protein